MNQKELIEEIGIHARLTKTDATAALEAALNAISRELEAGGDIRLPGFGAFTVAERPAREGRHPFSGEKIRIPAKRRTKFKEAAALKEMLNHPPVRLAGARRLA